MSLEASTLVWNHSNQKGTSLLVMLALANWADEDLIAFPSIVGIAKKARCGTRNTNNIIARLQEIGDINIIGHLPSGRNKYRITITPKAPPTTYGMPEDKNIDPALGCRPEVGCRPSVDNDGENGTTSSMDPATGCRSATECRSEVDCSARSALGFPQVCTPVQTTLKDTKVNTKESLSHFWNDFKKHYPDRGGLELDLASAEDIFFQLVENGEDPEAMVEGAKVYRSVNASMAQPERKYIRNAKNFLKKQIWRQFQPKATGTALIAELDPDTPAAWRTILESWPQQSAAQSWLYPLKLISATATQVHLVAPSTYHKSRILQDYFKPLQAAWLAIEPGLTDFKIFVEGEIAA